MRAIIIPRDDGLRPKAEQLITEVYAQHYGARITTFPDTLVARIAADKPSNARLGLRFAAEGFFSEAYLDAPIEDAAVSDRTYARSPREDLRGHLTREPRAALVGSFLRKIIACGEAAGFEWAFFTATLRSSPCLSGWTCLSCRWRRREIAGGQSRTRGEPTTSFAPRVYAVRRDDSVGCALASRPRARFMVELLDVLREPSRSACGRVAMSDEAARSACQELIARIAGLAEEFMSFRRCSVFSARTVSTGRPPHSRRGWPVRPSCRCRLSSAVFNSSMCCGTRRHPRGCDQGGCGVARRSGLASRLQSLAARRDGDSANGCRHDRLYVG